MIRSIRLLHPLHHLQRPGLSAVVILALSAVCGVAVQAGEQPLAPNEKNPDSTQFTRIVEPAALSAKPLPSAALEAPAAACQAGQNQANLLGTIRHAELKLAEMRKQQLAAWAARGWTAKQAAAAGESVVLNGSGYNLTGAPRQ